MITTHVQEALGEQPPSEDSSPKMLTESTQDIKQFDNTRKETKKDLQQPKKSKVFIANVSAYTAAADECGKSDGITASGKKVQAHHTIACPKSYPFGTKIHFEGYGTYTCDDRGGAIKNNRFDIYMVTKHEAFAFGRQRLTAYIVEA